NQGTLGGAIYVGPNALLRVEKSSFYTNTATTSGGAVYLDGGTLALRQSRFYTNTAPSTTAGRGGGALFVQNGIVSADNNLFVANQAGEDGGAIFLNGAIPNTAQLWNNTFVANQAGDAGGAIANNAATGVAVVNALLIQNTAVSGGAVAQTGAGSISVTYSDIWQNSTPELAGTISLGNNFSADPRFADPLYRLDRGSPALDAGSPATSLTVDFEDDARPADQGYDVGYDELTGCRAQRDGIPTPFGSIQEALAATPPAGSLPLVRVTGICRGTNQQLVGGQPVNQTVFITTSITLQGGWSNDFTALTGQDTFIDPEGAGRAVYVSGAVSLTLESLYLVNGNAAGLGGGPGGADAGGAVYNEVADLALVNVRILTNTATLGGALYNQLGTVTFSSVEAVPPILSPAPFNYVGNNTASSGGAIYQNGGVLRLDGVRVYSNTASANGGGIYLAGGSSTITNTVLYVNQANNGAALYNAGTDATLLHLSVYSNTAAAAGGGIYTAGGSPTVRSSIFDSNRAGGSSGIAIFIAGGTPDLDYNYHHGQGASPVNGAGPGPNSIVDNVNPPGFTDPNGGDFHLLDTAAVLDIADPASPATTDFDGDPRPSNQGPDIGADELVGCVVSLNGVIYGSIQTALDAASPGDTLRVAGACSGVHAYDTGSAGGCGGATGAILTTVHLTKSVHLEGGWNVAFTNQNDVTTLDARGLGRVLYVGPGITSTVSGFHIVNGLLTGPDGNGAGICVDNAAPTISSNHVYSNTATNGAAMYAVDSPAQLGGGNHIYLNTATTGAAVYVNSAPGIHTTVQNNFIYSNTATNGGAIANGAGSSNLWHNTIYSNTASSRGGAFYVVSGSPLIRSNIVMSNAAGIEADGAYGLAGATPSLGYNDFFGQADDFGGTITDGGPGHISADPNFKSIPMLDFTVPFASPVVDVGDPTLPITDDFEADIRPTHQSFDIGADEVGGCYARVSSLPNVIFGSVQAAVDQAVDGDVVDVDGTCYGVSSRLLPGSSQLVTQTLLIAKDITLNGSWSYQTNVTATLDARGRGRVLFIASNTTVTITNIILQRGSAANAGLLDGAGGNIWNDGDLLLLDSNVVTGTAQQGGGIYNVDNLVMRGTTLRANTAVSGAALYNNTLSGGAFLTQGNLLEHNTASQNVGGIFQNHGKLSAYRNTPRGNQAVNGAGVYLSGGTDDTLDVRNSFFYSNSATTQAAGIYDANTNGRLWHNTIVNNAGGGIYSASSAAFSIHSNIVDSNTGAGIHTTAPNPDVDYNNVVANATNYAGTAAPGPHGISAAPDYVDPANQDYHLQETSRGVDEGDPNITSVGIFNDYDNDLRPTNGGPDIGADEFNSCLIRVINPLTTDPQIFGVLQDAIDYAESFAGTANLPTVEIARGTCSGVKLRNGTYQVGYISEDLHIIGSLRRSNFSDPGDYYTFPIYAVSSAIDAEGNGRGLSIAPGASPHLEQIAIVNGNAYAANDTNDNGGGVYHPGPGYLLTGVVETCQNTAENGGGYYVAPTAEAYISGAGTGDCWVALFDENEQYIGDAFYDGNKANTHGGAIYIASGSQVDIVNHGLDDNAAINGSGGAVYNLGSQTVIINAFVFYNLAHNNGGGLYDGASISLYHNTFRGNTAVNGDGGGIYHTGGTLTLNSSIIYANVSNGATGGGLFSSTGGANQDYNLYDANIPDNSNAPLNAGTGNFVDDPQLFGGALSQYSPAIDRADPDLLLDVGSGGVWPGGIDFDAGNYRRPDVHPDYAALNPIWGYASDIGADEYWKEFGCSVQQPSQNATVLPGDVISYQVDVINVGFPSKLTSPFSHGFTDTISITLQSSTGWATLLGGDRIVDLDYEDLSRDRVNLTISVTVPATATTGIQDVTRVQCTSLSLPSRKATGTMVTNVGLVSGVQVGPEYVTSAAPGQVLTFTHWITNTGNETGLFQLIPNAGAAGLSTAVLGATSRGITDVVSLDPTEAITAEVVVTILDTAAIGSVANPGLIARSTTDPTKQGQAINQITVRPAGGTRYVAIGGSDAGNNCRVAAQPCATVQRAVDQAEPGDTILVAAGAYTDQITRTVGTDLFEQVLFVDKSVSIRGGYTVNEPVPFTTVAPLTNTVFLDGAGLRRVLYVADGVTVTLSGLVIQNGGSYAPGSVDDLPDFGGNIYNAGGNLTLVGSWVLSGTAKFGGALYQTGGSLALHSSVVAANSTSPNPQGLSGIGGGLHVVSSTVTLENNTFAGNTADGGGSRALDGTGGAYYQITGTLTLTNNIFANQHVNPSGSGGSALYVEAGVTVLHNDYNLYFNNTGASDTNFGAG
ncbi:MAG: hypothetical protein KC425_10340, partial [Anaerolineales bacterium]|nr:hypothetical protein [Anaerolineales bacterium]